jgi:hypothetical protein
VQHVAVFSLSELRPQPSWYEGGSRMMDIRGRRGKGNGRHGPSASRPQSSRRQRNAFGEASRKEEL